MKNYKAKFAIFILIVICSIGYLFLSNRSQINLEDLQKNDIFYPASRQQRPELVGRELTHGTKHFLVHYTDQGDNATLLTDNDKNGIPDFVEKVANDMENAWEYEINRMGFSPPVKDGGIGGDSRFDIYLQPISYFAYATGAGGVIGDNPLTLENEGRAAFTYMALDNTFADYIKYGISAYDALGITSAHEFNHSIQYGYDANEELWLMESTAALIEKIVYPKIHDNIGYLVAQSDTPDQCLPRSKDFYHAYSHWYFLKYIVENNPDREKIIPRIWEKARDLDGLWALNAALDGKLDQYWGDWVVANLVRQDCPKGKPYCMNEATLYPPVNIEGRISPNGWDGYLTYIPPSGVGSYGVDYIDLSSMTATQVPLDLAFIGKTSGVNYAVRLIGFKDSPIPEIIDMNLKGDIKTGVVRFDATKYSRLYLTVENRTPVLEANCGRVQGDYVIGVTRVGESEFFDASSISAPELVLPGKNFDVILNQILLVGDESEATTTVTIPSSMTIVSYPSDFKLLEDNVLVWHGPLTSKTASSTVIVRLPKNVSAGKSFDINAVMNGSKLSKEFSFNANVHTPQNILLVNDAGYDSKSEELKAALDSNEISYDVWNTVDRGSPTAETLNFYTTLIWNTGKTNVETLINDDRVAISSYLKMGGKFILTGTDVVYEQSTLGTDDSREFLKQILGISLEAESYQMEEGTISLSNLEGQKYNLSIPVTEPEVGGSPDIVAPVDGKSKLLISYPDSRAASVRSLDGKIIMASLDFSQLNLGDGSRLIRSLLKPN